MNIYGNTLVVCPVSLVGQWVREAKKHIPDLDHDHIYLHHGQSRGRNSRTIAQKKIVVTTYGIVAKEANFRMANNGRKGSLENILWHRIIFDESHVLKNSQTMQYRSAKALRATHKWCVSGTPLTYDNQINSQIALITNTFEKIKLRRKHGLTDPLLAILSHYMIRHRKTMKIDGQPIVELPECHVQNISVEMTAEERTCYTEAIQVAAARIPFMVGLSAFREIQNVRRLLSNSSAIANGATAAIEVCNDAVREIAEQRIAQDHCAICLDIYDIPTITACSHVFCLRCIQHVLSMGRARCPLCRQPCAAPALRLVHPLPDVRHSDNMQGFHTKIHRAGDLLNAHPDEKWLVFFHFQQTLDNFATFLKTQRVEYCQLNSGMAQRAREKALSQFENDPTKRVFLLSVRSSAVGINLTGASRVILFEPFMNVALEKQSISRSWRLGQTRAVAVYRMHYANSLEQRIVHLPDTNTWDVLNIRRLLE